MANEEERQRERHLWRSRNKATPTRIAQINKIKLKLILGSRTGGQMVVVEPRGGKVSCKASVDFKEAAEAITSCCKALNFLYKYIITGILHHIIYFVIYPIIDGTKSDTVRI